MWKQELPYCCDGNLPALQIHWEKEVPHGKLHVSKRAKQGVCFSQRWDKLRAAFTLPLGFQLKYF